MLEVVLLLVIVVGDVVGVVVLVCGGDLVFVFG